MNFLSYIDNLFRKQPKKHQFFFHLSLDKKENIQLVRQYVMYVSRYFDEPEQFAPAAAEVASKIGKDRIPLLFYLLYENGMNEGEQKQDMTLLFQQVLENTVFEILYNFGEEAYLMLFDYTFHSEKKMSYKSVEILCRMAADGIHTKEIVQEINQRIDYSNDQQIIPVLHALSLIQKNKTVDTIFSRTVKRYLDQYPKNPKNLRKGLSILRRWAYSNSEGPKAYLPLLKDISLGRTQKRKSVANAVEIKTLERVRAALIYDYLIPSDKEIHQQFNKWLVMEENPEIRQYIIEQLEENWKHQQSKI